MAIANEGSENISAWVEGWVKDESSLAPTYRENELDDLIIKLDMLVWFFNKLSRPKSANLIRRCQNHLREYGSDKRDNDT